MGESLKIGDFGHIVFYITERHYFYDKEKKLRYDTTKVIRDYEGMEIIDVDKSRVLIEGLDKEELEIFNIRRSQVVSFEKQDRPEIKVEEAPKEPVTESL